jgi:hypothetical protein
MVARIMLLSILALALLASSGAARAGEPGAGRAKAREVYKLASQHYKLAEYKEALAGFKEAYRLTEEPALLFNIAQCHRMMNEKPEAIRFFRNYLNDAGDAPNVREVREIIARLEKEIEDEKASKNAPPAGLAAPKSEPPPGPTPAIVAPAPAGPPFPTRPLKIAGLTLLGVGVASVILGATFAGLAGSAAHQASSPADGVFHPADEDRMNLYQNLDIAFFVTGGILVAGGLSAFLVGQLHRNIEVAPTAGPGHAGATVTVEF